MASSTKRIIIRIEITQGAKTSLEAVSDRHGMTQVSVTSRLVEWFGTQSEVVQAAILGRFPSSIAPEVARLILRKMSGMDEKE